MRRNLLQQYVALHSALIKEKAGLEERLKQINQALSSSGTSATGVGTPAPARVAPAPAPPPAAPAKGRARRPRRIKNKYSLEEAVRQVTSVKALTKPEILTAIDKIGYRFAAKNPMNSLNTLVYTKGKFKNAGGKFSLLK